MTSIVGTDQYVFDSGSDLGRTQLDNLARLLDPVTTEFLVEIGVRPGQRCLDLGAGGGSITRWLAERTGPSGTVVAVDLDTTHLAERPGVEVHQRDVNDGLPVGGTFDLIHARLVLVHLARRVDIVRTLVDALAPGGWLVIGEYGARRPHAVAAPDRADAELFDRIQDVGHDLMARAGVRVEWAHEAQRHFADAGLTDLHAQEYSLTTAGRTTGCLLHRNYVQQLARPLRAEGVTDDQLARYCDLMLGPRFRAWFHQFVQTRGRKAAT